MDVFSEYEYIDVFKSELFYFAIVGFSQVSSPISSLTSPHISHCYLMLGRRCLELQTELVDLFLPEISLLFLDCVVNLNNTQQLDSLLRHLELSTRVSTFNVVPSITVLHILFTLSIRSSSLNWSHDWARLELLVSSEYMKQVNQSYDLASYHDLLQKRASRVLHAYTELASEETAAAEMLHQRMESVVLSLLPAPDSTSDFPRIAKSKEPSEMQSCLSTNSVEVISDSEESDEIVDFDDSLVIPKSPSKTEPKILNSFTDLGSRTSGLGEIAVLFKDMPHLLTQPSPEPPESDRKWKRPRRQPSLDEIRLFDDVLLFKRLQEPSHYSIWSVIRWTFWCAELSSQHQECFLNCSQSQVKGLYEAYSSTLLIVVRFCELLYRRGATATLKNRLFDVLGFAAHDRAIEFIFTGLGVATNDLPSPCYSREKIVISSDPVIHNSQCKERTVYCANAESMALRLRLLELLLFVKPLRAANALEAVDLLTEKLLSLPATNVDLFLSAAQARIAETGTDGNILSHVIMKVVFSLLQKRTGVVLNAPSTCTLKKIVDAMYMQRTCDAMMQEFFSDKFESFLESWQRFLTLCARLIELAMTTDQDISPHCYIETYETLKSALEQATALFCPTAESAADEGIEEEFFTPNQDFDESRSSIEVISIVPSSCEREKIISSFNEVVLERLSLFL